MTLNFKQSPPELHHIQTLRPEHASILILIIQKQFVW